MEPAWKCLLNQLIYKYRDSFVEGSEDIGCAIRLEHKVHLTNQVLTILLYWHIPTSKIPLLKAHVKGLLERGVIKESVSLFAVHILVVRKKDGTIRFCVDFGHLNKVSEECFPVASYP